jgi:hypothetical protein
MIGVAEQPMILMKYLALPADRKDDINKELEAYEAHLQAEKQRKRERSNANLQLHSENLVQPGSNTHNADENLSSEALARKHAKRGEQCSQCKKCGTADDLLGLGGRNKKPWRERLKDPAAVLICKDCPDHRERCTACKRNCKTLDYCRNKQGHTDLGWNQGSCD